LQRWRLDTPAIVSPRFSGRFGHPVLLDGALLDELRAVSEETLGLRAVIDAHVEDAVSVEIKNQAVDVDLNTPAEYEAAFASFAAGKWDENAEE
jgi:CTP:molybdopterin cytidylyltransferase MocA